MPRIIERVEPKPLEVGTFICIGSTDDRTPGCGSKIGVEKSDLFRTSRGGAAFTCPVCGADTTVYAAGPTASEAPPKAKHAAARAWDALVAEMRRNMGTNVGEMDEMRRMLACDRERGPFMK